MSALAGWLRRSLGAKARPDGRRAAPLQRTGRVPPTVLPTLMLVHTASQDAERGIEAMRLASGWAQA